MKLFQKIFLILFVPLIFFCLIEFFLRISPWNDILGPQRFSGGLEDHSLFWDPKNIIRIPIDRYRFENEFRGKKVRTKKSKNVYRIICLGGSFTYGWPYNNDPYVAYPAVLERLLNKQPNLKKKYEIINAGVGGYTSYQGLFYFKNRLYKLNPDLVTVCFGANDGNINYEIGVFCSDREYYERLVLFAQHKYLFRIKSFLNNLRIYALMEKIIFNIKKIFVKPKERVSHEEFEKNLKEFVDLSNKYNFKLLFIMEPHRGLRKFEEEVKINPYYRIMYKLACKYPERVVLVDTISLVRQYKNEEDKIFYDIMHLTPFGHKILANSIFHILKGKNIIH